MFTVYSNPPPKDGRFSSGFWYPTVRPWPIRFLLYNLLMFFLYSTTYFLYCSRTIYCTYYLRFFTIPRIVDKIVGRESVAAVVATFSPTPPTNLSITVSYNILTILHFILLLLSNSSVHACCQYSISILVQFYVTIVVDLVM